MSVKKKLFISMLTVSMIVLALIIIGIINRITWCPYEVTKSYDYNFKHSINLNLNNGKFVLPDSIGQKYTAFLKIYIQSSYLGKYIRPSVEIKSNKLSFSQYFEHGAEGYRYINISNLNERGVKEINLIGKKVIINDQIAQLVLFEKLDLSKLKILVIAPHPDDAEIAAYGLYSKYPNSFILTITAGDAGGFNYDELFDDTIRHYLKKGHLRTWNSITVPLIGGISFENTLNLGFFDGTLKQMFAQNPSNVSSLYLNSSDINIFRKYNVSNLKNNLSGTSNWNSLVSNLKYILSEVNPDIIITPYPALDNHPDHKFSSIALFQALKELEVKKGSLFLYTNHYILKGRYPYGTTGCVVSLPPNFNDDIYFNTIFSNSNAS